MDDRRLHWALAASLLLHLLLVAILVAEPWTWRIAKPPEPQEISMVFPEAPKSAAPKPAEPPKPAAAEKPPPAQAQPAPIPLPPPSTPQLQRAPLAEKSEAPPSPGDRARRQLPSAETPQAVPPKPQTIGPGPKTAPPLKAEPQRRAEAGNRAAGAGSAAGPTGKAMTQSESDFFLSQIVSAWVIDFDAPKFRDIQIYGQYKVLPNGMLAPPFGKNDPWDIHAMVNNWDEIARIPEAAAFRTAIETFLRAMRLAQPFHMPPDATGYPKTLQLNFRIGDL
ncbi:hypothetical protein [Ferrovibrio xuzhouensis]|uniref:Uncharacterized protein n=1 Tax=Ferrovibrio xuzhouensis TaxID=1576914 RepID=A0ABV7V9T5_9PROT